MANKSYNEMSDTKPSSEKIETITDEKNHSWDKHEISTGTTAPVVDQGFGKHTLIRRFIVCTSPDSPATAEEVLKHHKPYLLTKLAQDKWTPIDEPKIDVCVRANFDNEPGVLPDFACDNHIFAIYFTCEAFGILREATHQKPFNASNLMHEASRQQNNA